jgi:hypothetical protein
MQISFAQKVGKMPRACPVEYYARRYTADLKQQPGGHGLGPWRFTFLAKIAGNVKLHGASPWHLKTWILGFS